MKDTVRYIFYIILILAIGIGATYFGRYVNRKFLGIERHDKTIKSLRVLIVSLKNMIGLLMNNSLLLIVLEELNKKLLLFMRKLKVILMIVISLVMIPFSAISQKRYKIDGDTVIVFTPKETRKLAIKLLEGEKYEKLYLTASEIQRVQDSVISFQSYHIAIRDSLLVVSFDGLDSLNSKLIDYQERYLAERKKKRRNGWIAAGSIALNAVLIFVSSR